MLWDGWRDSISLGVVRHYEFGQDGFVERYFAVLRNGSGEFIAVKDITTSIELDFGGSDYKDTNIWPKIKITGDADRVRLGSLKVSVVKLS